MGEMRKGGLEDLPFISVVAPATRPLAIAYLLATQRTTRARCEGLGVSDTAKLQLFHKSARLCAFFLCPFSLMRRDRRIKADIKGPTHKAGVVGEPVEPPLPHVGRGPRAQPGEA